MTSLVYRPGPTIARMLLGGVWIAGAGVNALWTLPHAAGAWSDLGHDATFAPYRWLFTDVVSAAPEFWTMLLIAGELGLGVMVLGKGASARAGLVGSLLWCLFLSFLIWPYTLMMPLGTLFSAWLLRHDHVLSVMDLVHLLTVTGKGS